MRYLSVARLTAVAMLAMTAAACTPVVNTPTGRPPTATATPATTTAAATPARSPDVAPRPARVAVPAPVRPPARGCLGAVIHRIDASDNGPPWRPLCMAVGGVLRVEHLGPEGFAVSPAGRTNCQYEAGVRECRLVNTGKVRVTITRGDAAVRTLSLTIVSGSVRPAPACPAVAPYPIDAAEGGPPWAALCLKLGAVLRVTNLGPEGFVVRPSAAVRCSYEAAVRDCRLLRTGTVTFEITHGDSPPRTLTVVVVR
ncbi:hypothetical protein AB0J74_12520 [Asanoa sp. NPDC049573]|uniref:hypothetical protein n=1 Tax=Asanoa sp. NPDC049573 TaxID=3155396 RepID=UPI003449FFE5